MARRGLLLVVAGALALLGVWAQALAGPLPALACTCPPPAPLADLAHQRSVLVFTGTVGVQQADLIPVAVEAWYHGAGAAPVVWLDVDDVPGGVATHDCGRPSLYAGERHLIVATGSPPGPIGQLTCGPAALLDTAAGAALVAEAQAAFGAPILPSPSDPGTTEPPTEPTDRPPGRAGQPSADTVAWPYAVGLIGAAALIFAVIAVLALRRRPSG